MKTVYKIKWLLAESYIEKLVEIMKNITCRSFELYILALEEEPKRNIVPVTLGHF